MKTYIIRFSSDDGSGHAEVVADTEADAREDFERRFPDREIVSAYVKPVKPQINE